MPLSQNDPSLDYGGSWGDASEGWPTISFPTEETARSAYVATWRDVKVPYGSYVLVGKDLRLETQEGKERVKVFLAARELLTWTAREAACQGRHTYFNGYCQVCDRPSPDGYWSSSPALQIYNALIALERKLSEVDPR